MNFTERKISVKRAIAVLAKNGINVDDSEYVEEQMESSILINVFWPTPGMNRSTMLWETTHQQCPKFLLGNNILIQRNYFCKVSLPKIGSMAVGCFLKINEISSGKGKNQG